MLARPAWAGRIPEDKFLDGKLGILEACYQIPGFPDAVRGSVRLSLLRKQFMALFCPPKTSFSEKRVSFKFVNLNRIEHRLGLTYSDYLTNMILSQTMCFIVKPKISPAFAGPIRSRVVNAPAGYAPFPFRVDHSIC